MIINKIKSIFLLQIECALQDSKTFSGMNSYSVNKPFQKSY